MKNIGIHKNHCCIIHGCKYGDKEYPVYLAIVRQRYRCEECFDNDDIDKEFILKNRKEKLKKLMRNKSKKISYLLRHNPEDLNMDNNGWVNVKDLLNKLNLNFNDLQNIIDTNNKKRFSFNENKTKIRANQGHTLKVDVELECKIPPKFLYHGTASRNVEEIKKNGISKMKRNHVHLSPDYQTALNVANRYCKNDTPYIFKIDTTPIVNEGVKFYLSKNGVWLVNYIDPKYL